MVLSDIRTKVANNVLRPDDIPDTSGGLIDGWIDDTQREICRAYNFDFMEAEATIDTTDEQRAYSLPTAGDSGWTEVDSGTVLRFKSEINLQLINSNNNRVPLIKAHKKDIEDKSNYRNTSDSGTPKYYDIQRGKIHLYNKPDHSSNSDTAWAITFEYYGYLADVSGTDAATNALISNHHEVLEVGATAKAFRYVHEFEIAREWQADFRGKIADMITETITSRYGTIEEGMAPRAGSGGAG